MIKVDGHACWHELLNNKKGGELKHPIEFRNDINKIEILHESLAYTDSICVEVTCLNLLQAGNLLEDYLSEFPNIKYALFYRTPKEYLNPNYALIKHMDEFNEFMNDQLNINVDFVNLSSISHTSIPSNHVDQIINHLEGLYWTLTGITDYPDEYKYTGTDQSNIYYSWWKMISDNRSSYSLEDYHNMIRSNILE